jgi:hypothetical protein
MNTIPKYDLRRVRRACGHNDDPKTPASQIIYDFEIVSNGEVLATWKKVYSGKGYELEDANGDVVHSRAPGAGDYNPDYYLRVRVAKKDEFVATLDGLFLAGRVPSPEEARALRAGWGRALLENREIDDAKTRDHFTRKHASALAAIAERAAKATCRDASIGRDAAALLDAITLEVLESIAFTRESRPFNAIEQTAVDAFLAEGGAK